MLFDYLYNVNVNKVSYFIDFLFHMNDFLIMRHPARGGVY